MSGAAKVRVGSRDDWTAVDRLLRDNKLPTDGLTTDVDHLYVAEAKGQVVGAIGFETYTEGALLRSFVVKQDVRGKGVGLDLMRVALQDAGRQGVPQVFGLTTTIPELLGRLGFTEIKRDEIPASVHRSQELGACPETARAFRLALA